MVNRAPKAREKFYSVKSGYTDFGSEKVPLSLEKSTVPLYDVGGVVLRRGKSWTSVTGFTFATSPMVRARQAAGGMGLRISIFTT